MNISQTKIKNSKATHKSTVYNKSSRKLSNDEIDLLEKGLKFVPTREKIDISKLLADLREWERRMRLKEFFNDSKEIPETQTKIKDKKYDKIEARERNKIFMPPSGRDLNLDLYIELIKEDIFKGISNQTKNNLTCGEKEALKSLMNDEDIVIRPADKGSGIVVMDRKDYISKVTTDLNENDSYKKLPKDTTTTVTNKVKKIVKEMHSKGWISDNLKRYMTPSLVYQGKVKANPKMHKNDMPIRTIISGINHPTERMAEVAEKELGE